MIKLFVTGTGTDVGKTEVCIALAKQALEFGKKVGYWKPLQCGFPTDQDRLVELLGSGIDVIPSAAVYEAPMSPDQAALKEGAETVTVRGLQRSLAELSGYDLLIVEGAGGLLVPMNEEGETWREFVEGADVRTCVVGLSGLGTLNHTSLTLALLRQTNVDLAGVVLSGAPHTDNERSLRRDHPSVDFYSYPETTDPKAASAAKDILLALTAGEDASVANDTVQMDQEHVWHPFTQHKQLKDHLEVSSARGAWLTLKDGRRVVDAVGSWWTCNLGHGDEELADTLARQARTLDHVIYAGVQHEPGSRLAAKLAEFTGGKLPKVFYSDNGSTSVEVGIKMAYQWWRNQGHSGRRKFLALNAAYHGDTFGAMAVGKGSQFHLPFDDLFFDVELHDPVTCHPSKFSPDPEAAREENLAALRQKLAAEPEAYAAVILEPLVLGAGGMLMQDPQWLRGLVDLCRDHGLLVILDEVFTGLGRVGEPFAFQRAGVDPDIVCIAKGLTGGIMPLSATLATERIYDGFLADSKQKALLHGHSFAGNPLGCAVALHAMEKVEEQKLWNKSMDLERAYMGWFETSGKSLGVDNARACGSVMAFELPGSATKADYFDPRSDAIREKSIDHGLMLRPLGNTVYMTPPLTLGERELQVCLDGLTRLIQNYGR